MENHLALKPGTVVRGPLHEYTVIRTLGQGGFGITYLVECNYKFGNIKTKIRVVLKEHFLSTVSERKGDTTTVSFLESSRETVERSLRAFIKEAGRVQKLGIESDNIVTVNEVFEANNTAYYAMEYLEGKNLAEYIAEKGRLSEEETRSIMKPIASAVAMLHKNHLAHYDIKPSNIILAHDDEGKIRPVLIDFGLAKHYDDGGEVTSSTLGLLGYSHGYAPIEQYTGITKFSPATDVYALGATLYHCLVGHRPENASDFDVRACPTSPAIWLTVRSAMSFRQTDRPTASEVAASLGASSSEATEIVTTKDEEATMPIAHVSKTDPKGLQSKKTVISTPPTLPKPKNSVWYAIWFLLVFAVLYCIIALRGCEPDHEYYMSDTIAVAEADVPEVDAIANDTLPKILFQKKNFSLCAIRNGDVLFFTEDEWKSEKDKNTFVKKGVYVSGDGLEFLVGLNAVENSKVMTWYEAMDKYKDVMPTSKECSVMFDNSEAINSAIIAFGGDGQPEGAYWSKDEIDSSHADFAPMFEWVTEIKSKSEKICVRPVYPVPRSMR